jgi:hypothetical protein
MDGTSGGPSDDPVGTWKSPPDGAVNEARFSAIGARAAGMSLLAHGLVTVADE